MEPKEKRCENFFGSPEENLKMRVVLEKTSLEEKHQPENNKTHNYAYDIDGMFGNAELNNAHKVIKKGMFFKFKDTFKGRIGSSMCTIYENEMVRVRKLPQLMIGYARLEHDISIYCFIISKDPNCSTELLKKIHKKTIRKLKKKVDADNSAMGKKQEAYLYPIANYNKIIKKYLKKYMQIQSKRNAKQSLNLSFYFETFGCKTYFTTADYANLNRKLGKVVAIEECASIFIDVCMSICDNDKRNVLFADESVMKNCVGEMPLVRKHKFLNEPNMTSFNGYAYEFFETAGVKFHHEIVNKVNIYNDIGTKLLTRSQRVEQRSVFTGSVLKGIRKFISGSYVHNNSVGAKNIIAREIAKFQKKIENAKMRKSFLRVEFNISASDLFKAYEIFDLVKSQTIHAFNKDQIILAIQSGFECIKETALLNNFCEENLALLFLVENTLIQGLIRGQSRNVPIPKKIFQHTLASIPAQQPALTLAAAKEALTHHGVQARLAAQAVHKHKHWLKTYVPVFGLINSVSRMDREERLDEITRQYEFFIRRKKGWTYERPVVNARDGLGLENFTTYWKPLLLSKNKALKSEKFLIQMKYELLRCENPNNMLVALKNAFIRNNLLYVLKFHKKMQKFSGALLHITNNPCPDNLYKRISLCSKIRDEVLASAVLDKNPWRSVLEYLMIEESLRSQTEQDRWYVWNVMGAASLLAALVRPYNAVKCKLLRFKSQLLTNKQMQRFEWLKGEYGHIKTFTDVFQFAELMYYELDILLSIKNYKRLNRVLFYERVCQRMVSEEEIKTFLENIKNLEKFKCVKLEKIEYQLMASIFIKKPDIDREVEIITIIKEFFVSHTTDKVKNFTLSTILKRIKNHPHVLSLPIKSLQKHLEKIVKDLVRDGHLKSMIKKMGRKNKSFYWLNK